MRLFNVIVTGVILAGTGVAFAQESEFQNKLKEDLTDPYQKWIISHCGTSEKLTIEWKGKLGANPRENEGSGTSVSTLATSALEGLQSACTNNQVVAKTMSKLTSIVVTRGKGNIGYKLSGGTITFTVDTSAVKDNPATQRDNLVEKLKKDLDK